MKAAVIQLLTIVEAEQLIFKIVVLVLLVVYEPAMWKNKKERARGKLDYPLYGFESRMWDLHNFQSRT